MVSSAGIRPIIDGVFRFSEARDAYTQAATHQQFGKIVIIDE
ncbi:zinc-binding dehydrogenase [Rhizobium sp. AG207R]|nr:zinc-binding dehydrogenase [Rhizobium sp. AG207R]